MGALYVTVSAEQMHDEAFGVDVTIRLLAVRAELRFAVCRGVEGGCWCLPSLGGQAAHTMRACGSWRGFFRGWQ